LSEPRRLGRWAPAAAWAAVIFSFSTGWFSSEHTGSVLLPVLGWLFPDWTPDRLAHAHAVVRSGAHVTEYTVLGFLLVRAFRTPDRTWGRSAVLAFVTGAAFAASDEVHQLFVPSRTPAPHDVGLDTAGVMLGITLAWLRRRVKRRRRA
jgi:VanZ family protein